MEKPVFGMARCIFAQQVKESTGDYSKWKTVKGTKQSVILIFTFKQYLGYLLIYLRKLYNSSIRYYPLFFLCARG